MVFQIKVLLNWYQVEENARNKSFHSNENSQTRKSCHKEKEWKTFIKKVLGTISDLQVISFKINWSGITCGTEIHRSIQTKFQTRRSEYFKVKLRFERTMRILSKAFIPLVENPNISIISLRKEILLTLCVIPGRKVPHYLVFYTSVRLRFTNVIR